MGCWGTGPFDTDAAQDWLLTVKTVWDAEQGLESSDRDIVYAAIGVVAWATGQWDGKAPLDFSEPMRRRVTRKAPRAAERCDQILTPKSELSVLWRDTVDYGEWKGLVEELRRVLRA